MSTARIDFGIRTICNGCVAWIKTPKRFQDKRFRNGKFSSANSSAKRWIDDEILSIKEMSSVEGFEMPDIYIDGDKYEL